MNDTAADVAVDTVSRIGRGYLNGTTRSQAYGILFLTALSGAASGVAGTVYFIKKQYVLVPKKVKVDNTSVINLPG